MIVAHILLDRACTPSTARQPQQSGPYMPYIHRGSFPVIAEDTLDRGHMTEINEDTLPLEGSFLNKIIYQEVTTIQEIPFKDCSTKELHLGLPAEKNDKVLQVQTVGHFAKNTLRSRHLQTITPY